MDQRKICGLSVVALSSIVVACLALGYVEYIDQPIVNTKSGAIRGKCVRVYEKYVTSFLGIPYAKPLIGKDRFRKSEPASYWTGILDATKKSIPCAQADVDLPWVTNVTSSEDCLHLNIWVPGQRNGVAEKKSVMVWIHGGGFYSGWSGEDFYDGAVLSATGDVVVVTMNYRVGSFGFFDAGTDDAPGNQGLMDQALALQWVKDNIEYFGGDATSITLFGESAGSISVGLHVISPITNKLFNKAIMQSSSPYHPQVASNTSTSIYKSNIFATTIGCANETNNLFTQPESVVDCMKKIPKDILSAAEGAIVKNLPYFFLPKYGDEFMPQSPIEAMNSGNFMKMPLLIGNNKDEGAIFLHQLLPSYFMRETAVDLNKGLATMVILGLFKDSTNPMPNVIADFYLKDVIDDDYEVIRKKTHDSLGDFIFVCTSVFFAEKMGNSHYYVFTHRPSNTKWGKWFGTTHFEDVPFVFGLPKINPSSYTKDEVTLSESMMESWSQFAKTGNPNVGGGSWPEYSRKQPEYKVFDTEKVATQFGPHTDQCNFWRTYFTSET